MTSYSPLMEGELHSSTSVHPTKKYPQTVAETFPRRVHRNFSGPNCEELGFTNPKEAYEF